MGGIFSLTECASKNIRGESDPLNAGIAGCAAGLVAGLKSKSIHGLNWHSNKLTTIIAHSIAKMCAACAGVGATMYAYEASGEFKGLMDGKTQQEKKDHRDSFFKGYKKAEEQA